MAHSTAISAMTPLLRTFAMSDPSTRLPPDGGRDRAGFAPSGFSSPLRRGWRVVVSNREHSGALAAAMLAERVGWLGTPREGGL
ncbi:MAG: hypothetical protein ACLGG4_04145 [Gammaproteobacteria bacterium]